MVMVMGLTFTSCKQDTQPRISVPTEFKLNRPAFADQLYLVQPGGSIEFTCSQANYGLATTPVYSIQVSDTESFALCEDVDFQTQNATIIVPAEAFSMAVCRLFGYEHEDQCVDNPRAVYVRAVSSISSGSDALTITSNVVKLDQVQVYFAIPVRDAIYAVGQPWGWDINSDVAPVYETEPGSLIYKGTLDVPAGEFQFRFYDELGSWDNFSIGAQDDDSPVDITFVDGQYSGECFYNPAVAKSGKGAWQCPTWQGGQVEVTVNLNTLTIVFQIP